MKTMQVTDTGIVMLNGSPVILTGIEAIKQKVKLRLRFFLGEWFLNTSEGVSWRQNIFVKNPNMTIVNSVIKEAILGTTGINGIVSFELLIDKTNRTLTVNFKAQTNYGIATLGVTI